jgi:hypothetical protein
MNQESSECHQLQLLPPPELPPAEGVVEAGAVGASLVGASVIGAAKATAVVGGTVDCATELVIPGAARAIFMTSVVDEATAVTSAVDSGATVESTATRPLKGTQLEVVFWGVEGVALAAGAVVEAARAPRAAVLGLHKALDPETPSPFVSLAPAEVKWLTCSLRCDGLGCTRRASLWTASFAFTSVLVSWAGRPGFTGACANLLE